MKIIALLLFAVLFVLAGCTISSLTGYAVGPQNPPGNLEPNPAPSVVTVTPTTITFQQNEQTKQITLTVRDTYVWKKVGFCATPCTDVKHWNESGVFTGTSNQGDFIDGTQGVSATLTLRRENVSQGNNFFAFYSCVGPGLCHNRKWVSVPFTATLVAATCGDSIKNGQETDIDCGGIECPKCPPGKLCDVPNDCSSGVCIQGRCATPTCSDRVKNQDETDVDCGGVCVQQGKACNANKECNVTTDCANGQCDQTTKTCVARCTSNNNCAFCGTGCMQINNLPVGAPTPVCVQPQPPENTYCVCQTGVDKCVPAKANNATILIKDFLFEPNNITVVNGTTVSWVNLGSAEHTATSDQGQPEMFNSGNLRQNQQFARIFSQPGTTQYECKVHPGSMPANVTTIDIKGTCSDGIKYGNETDIDCGGACVGENKKCADGKRCKVASDCQSNVCTNGVCQTAPGCNNQRQDPGETDVDCGGSITIATPCPRCDDGKKCLVDTDCTGKKCKPDAQNVLRCTSLPDFVVGIGFGQLSGTTLPVIFGLRNLGTANITQQIGLQYNVTFPDTPSRPSILQTINVDAPKITNPFGASTFDTTVNVDLGSSLSVNVTAIIDPLNQVEELNENNNRNVTETSFSLTDPGLPGRQTTSCTSNTDCSGGNVCDTATKICVQCLDNNNCPPGKKCDTATKTCVDKCQGVSCQSGQVCNPSDGACVQCISDSNCPGKKCDATTHTCIDKCQGVTCTGTTPKCDPATGGCVQCLDSTHCLDGKICASATKTCVQCIGDGNCPAGKRCDITTKTCVEKCVGVTCPSGQVCNPADEQCVACLDDSNCPNKKCDTTTHTCVDKCQGVSCTGTTPKCNPATGGCVQCLATADCSSGQACTNNQCTTVTPQCVTISGSYQPPKAISLPQQCFNSGCNMVLTQTIYGGSMTVSIRYVQIGNQFIITGQQCLGQPHECDVGMINTGTSGQQIGYGWIMRGIYYSRCDVYPTPANAVSIAGPPNCVLKIC